MNGRKRKGSCGNIKMDASTDRPTRSSSGGLCNVFIPSQQLKFVTAHQYFAWDIYSKTKIQKNEIKGFLWMGQLVAVKNLSS